MLAVKVIIKNEKLMRDLLEYNTPEFYEYVWEDFLPSGAVADINGNYIYTIGDSRTMFTAHLDTVGQFKKTKLQYKKGIFSIVGNDSVLGADDKAGVYVLLHMIEAGIAGTYAFFSGEESGGIGSNAYVLENDLSKFDRIISFDRRGKESIITHQYSQRCCSDEFASELAKALDMKLDTGGSFTDSANFMDDVPECTNISVGYENEHTARETLDFIWLQQMVEKVIKIDFELLPVKRDPSVYEYDYPKYNYSKYNYKSKNYYNYSDDYGYKDDYGSYYCDYKDKNTYEECAACGNVEPAKDLVGYGKGVYFCHSCYDYWVREGIVI